MRGSRLATIRSFSLAADPSNQVAPIKLGDIELAQKWEMEEGLSGEVSGKSAP